MIGFNPCFTGRTTSTRKFLLKSENKMLVSILVLLEEPLQQQVLHWYLLHHWVSILVLLEEPLQLMGFNPGEKPGQSFNPCFTGRTTSTRQEKVLKWNITRFNPCFTGRTTSTAGRPGNRPGGWRVSILVLLEEPLQHFDSKISLFLKMGFNPCFTGRTTST